MSPPHDKHDAGGAASRKGLLISHLLELRSRMMRAVMAVIFVFLGLTPFMNPVFEFVSKPLRERVARGLQR